MYNFMMSDNLIVFLTMKTANTSIHYSLIEFKEHQDSNMEQYPQRKIAFIRNPVDRYISSFFTHNNTIGFNSMEEMLSLFLNQLSQNKIKFISRVYEPQVSFCDCVDEYLLLDDWNKVFTTPLKRVNTSLRPERNKYILDNIDDTIKKEIESLFPEDMSIYKELSYGRIIS